MNPRDVKDVIEEKDLLDMKTHKDGEGIMEVMVNQDRDLGRE